MRFEVKLSSDSKVELIQNFVNDVQNGNVKFYIGENQEVQMEWPATFNPVYKLNGN